MPFALYNIADNSTPDTTVGLGGVIAPLLTTASVADAAGLALALTTHRQAFALAINLETYSQRSDVIISGVNTLSKQKFFECNLGAQTAATYTIDFYYSLFDQILIKDQNGILSVRF